MGNLIKIGPKAVPLGDANVRNDELRFRISENDGQLTEYVLTMVVSGNPLFDRQITLDGTASSPIGQSTITLYPVGDSLGGHRVATAPVVVHKLEPRYTEQAREAKVQGTVLLKVEIEETGMISKNQIRVVRSLGYGLDEAAVECVRQWRFKPAFENGYAVKSAASIEVNFRP